MYNLQGTKVPQRLKKLTLVASNHTSSIKKLLPSPFSSQPNSPIQNNALPNLRFDIENYIYQMNSSKREEDFLSGKELTQRTNMIKSLLTEEKRQEINETREFKKYVKTLGTQMLNKQSQDFSQFKREQKDLIGTLLEREKERKYFENLNKKLHVVNMHTEKAKRNEERKFSSNLGA